MSFFVLYIEHQELKRCEEKFHLRKKISFFIYNFAANIKI